MTREIQAKLVAYGVPEATDRILACAEAGASGYLAEDASAEELLARMEDVVREDFVYPPMIVAGLIKRVALLAERPSASEEASLLSPRELQIVDFIARGFSNKEIARDLSIETNTVKNHVHNILTKLHVRRRYEAAYLLKSAGSGQAER
jgi:DNA-binding NarL/FixJ family response regulator